MYTCTCNIINQADTITGEANVFHVPRVAIKTQAFTGNSFKLTPITNTRKHLWLISNLTRTLLKASGNYLLFETPLLLFVELLQSPSSPHPQKTLYSHAWNY